VPVSYTYDANGRLAAVTNGSGQTASYHYDAEGNVTSITSAAQPPPSTPQQRGFAARAPVISSVSPAQAAPGATIVIDGRGFSTHAAADVVRVGKLFALVRRVSATQIVVAAPPGTGGAVSVTTPGGSATGAGVRTGMAPSAAFSVQKENADPLRAPKGETALSGLVLTSANRPLAGVRLTVTTVNGRVLGSTVSDAAGRFLVSQLRRGTLDLVINGNHVPGRAKYGLYDEPVELPAGKTTVLPWDTYLTALDLAHATAIPSPTTKEITLTNPNLPGLEVQIPKGTVIHDHFGRIVHQLSLTPLAAGRTPLPWGPGMVPQYFTLQPGDAKVSGAGLRVIYPNHSGQPAGTPIPYLIETPDWPGTGWWRYGTGHVSANGRQIIPDAGTVYSRIDPGGYPTPGPPPSPGPPCNNCGEPVNLSTGLWVHGETDLSLPDVLPVTLGRIFRQNDDTVRDFGIGWSSTLNDYISLASNGDDILVMPDGFQVVYAPTGTTGVYRALGTQTAFLDSTLSQDTSDRFGPLTITVKDGTVMHFGDPGFLTRITDRYGNSITINRVQYSPYQSGGGDIRSVTTPDGRWLSFTYGPCTAGTNPSLCITQVQDNSGRTTTYSYDSKGRLIQSAAANGGIYKYTWASCTATISCTELLSVTDPDGHTSPTNTYDPSTGRVTSQTTADGGTWSYSYVTNASGAVTGATVTDPLGTKHSYTFDSNGNPTTITDGVGTSSAETWHATYSSPSQLLTSSTDPLGRETTYTYDSSGNLLTTTQLAGTSNAATTTFTYEPQFNRLASITDPLNHTASIAYNDVAQTETLTDPLGHAWGIQLSPSGQPIGITDPLGQTTYLSYRNDDLVAIADPLGRVTSMFYDSVGHPIAFSDPAGNLTQQSWTPLDELASQTDPLGDTTTVNYDANGNPTSVTDANDHTTTFAWDPMNLLSKRTDALGNSAAYTYDKFGDLSSFTDRNGTVNTFAYDLFGRLSLARFGVTGSSAQSTITPSYDLANRLVQVVDTGAGTYGFTYNGLDDVLSASSPQGTVSYTYDLAGRRTGMTAPNQSAVGYSYDAANELTKLVQGTSTVSLAYDADMRQTALTLPDGITRSTSYDAASEPTSLAFTHSGTTLGSLAYTYNADSQIATVSGTLARLNMPAAITSATYNADNELTSRDGTTYTYDKNGQLLSDGTNTYTWSARHELASIAGASSASFTYDPFGRRALSKIGGTSTAFLFDGPNVIQGQAAGVPTENLLTGGANQYFQLTTPGGENSSFLTDTLGSTTALGNSAGMIATTYTYDPNGVAATSGSATANQFEFAGTQNDGTGLYGMGARYYSPVQERFISQDPIGFHSGTTDLYSYVGGDPVNLTDPTGLDAGGGGGGGGAGGGGGSGGGGGGSGGGGGGSGGSWYGSAISAAAGAVANAIGGSVKFAWSSFKTALGWEKKAEQGAQMALDVNDALHEPDDPHQAKGLLQCGLKALKSVLPLDLIGLDAASQTLDKATPYMEQQHYNGTINGGEAAQLSQVDYGG
jgi:RHS repeat-associated protein